MKWLALALIVVSATKLEAGEKCKSAEDCGDDECCVNYAVVSFFGGHCQKMRLEGETCTPLLKESAEPPPMHHFQCPCREGLNCVAQYEIKVGSVTVRHRPECVVPEKENTDSPIITPPPE